MGEAGCPSLEQLAAFAGAGLAGARREEVEQHLAQCDECSMVVAAFLDDGKDIEATTGSEELDSAEVRRYRIVRMLGTGGMGTVYEAEEVQADRRVALKLARDAEGAEGQTLLRRFSREARIAALLEHPNIVPVFDIGEFPDGTPYYTQRLIDGQSLASVIAACKLPSERIGLLRHFREMCDALAYAHGRGIIHRDIKSANVIIGHSGETWVIDWGLARASRPGGGDEPSLLDDSDALAAVTQAGAALGTPAYMSPEQARGESDRVDERSDVWSLGAVLLEILSGRPPFAELRSNEVLRRLRADQGPELGALRMREVPPELAAIARKALTIRREERYPSAIELADDVNRWMLGQPVSAYQYNARQRAWLLLRRHRVLSAAAAVAILAGAGWAVSLRAAFSRLAGQRADSLFQYATHALTNMQWDRAAVDFASALELDDRRDARLGLALAEADSPRPLWQRPAEVGVIRAAAFVDQDTAVLAGEDGFAAAFELQSGGELARRKLAGNDPAAAGCAGTAAISAGTSVHLWRPRGDLSVGSFSLAAPVRVLAFNQDCTLLALAGRDGVQVRRASGEQLASAPGDVLAVGFAGPRLVWATRSAVLVSNSALELAAPLVLHQERPLRAGSIASGRVLLLFEDGKLAFFDLADPARMIDSGGALAVLEHSTLLPDGRSAVGVGKGFGTWFFDADTGVAFCSLAALSRPVFALALTPDGRYLAEGGEDRKLRIYDLSSVRTYAGVHPSGSAGARDLDWSLDGSLLATAEDDGAIRLWDREGPRPRAPLGRHPAPAEAVRFSPDGALLASSGGGEVRLWDVSSGGERARDAVAAHALAWLSSRELLLGGDDGIRSRADGALRRIGDGRGVLSLAASRDGNGWAAGDSTGALTLFARDGAVLARNLAAHSDPIVSLAFSADGRTLASGGRDGAVRLWDTEALAPRGELLAYGAGAVNAVALAPPDSPAAGLLVASYAGGRTYFWDPNQDAPLLALGLQIPTSPGAISSRFSPDGSQVALLNAANALRIAPLAPSPRGSLQRLMKLYKYVPEGLDVMRAEEALVPPALQGKR